MTAQDAVAVDGPSRAFRELREEANQHPLWDCKLLRCCDRGYLNRRDYQFVFSQYHLYSVNFTRYLAALLVTCESDLHRSKLMRNLWEESGAVDPSQRHAELFRRFLQVGLGVDPETIVYGDSTRHFVEKYLTYCQKASPPAAAAFLALGTEGIVPRLYGIFTKGLRRIAVDEPSLRFFDLHVECDDEHAATLQELTAYYANRPGWKEQVRQGMLNALEARLQFFDGLHQELKQRRVSETLRSIDERRSLFGPNPSPEQVVFDPTGPALPLYENRMLDRRIDFVVERIPFAGNVLDARLVRISPGRCNELHKHAHESIFYVVRGSGIVRVNESSFPVKAGDTAFVPRWATHQTENAGSEELVVLAVTDYNLTSKALIGNYNHTARYRQDVEQPAP